MYMEGLYFNVNIALFFSSPKKTINLIPIQPTRIYVPILLVGSRLTEIIFQGLLVLIAKNVWHTRRQEENDKDRELQGTTKIIISKRLTIRIY